MSISYLFGYGKVLFMELNGFAVLAQTVVGIAQATKGCAFLLSISYLPGYGNDFLMELDGFTVIAQTAISIT